MPFRFRRRRPIRRGVADRGLVGHVVKFLGLGVKRLKAAKVRVA